ncbi:MAG: His/Gly/Thr/Pro-type tRNA ligase C-terminal domain-containing protein, partial [Spirochaetota bacterium]
FPVWLSPVQVILVSVGDEQADYVNRLKQALMASDVRVETDVRSESVSYKIRDAVGQKVPYVGVIGPKEMEENTISIRKRGENKPYAMDMDEFISALKTEIVERIV